MIKKSPVNITNNFRAISGQLKSSELKAARKKLGISVNWVTWRIWGLQIVQSQQPIRKTKQSQTARDQRDNRYHAQEILNLVPPHQLCPWSETAIIFYFFKYPLVPKFVQLECSQKLEKSEDKITNKPLNLIVYFLQFPIR